MMFPCVCIYLCVYHCTLCISPHFPLQCPSIVPLLLSSVFMPYMHICVCAYSNLNSVCGRKPPMFSPTLYPITLSCPRFPVFRILPPTLSQHFCFQVTSILEKVPKSPHREESSVTLWGQKFLERETKQPKPNVHSKEQAELFEEQAYSVARTKEGV